MTKTHSTVLIIISILWFMWGIVHAFAGAMIIYSDTATAFAAVADAVDPALLSGPYHDAAVALVNQHGFNLLWIGLTTIVSAIFIWRGVETAMLISGLTGGLADVGYFLFLDLGGFVHFFPGTVMTLISGSAVMLSFWIWSKSRFNQQKSRRQ